MISGNEHKKSPANNVSWQQFFFRENLIDKSKKTEPHSFRAESTVEIVDTNMIIVFHE